MVASALSRVAITRRYSVVSPLTSRRDALERTMVFLIEGFRRKDAAIGILHPKTVNVINRTHQQARIETHFLRYHDNILLDCF